MPSKIIINAAWVPGFASTDVAVSVGSPYLFGNDRGSWAPNQRLDASRRTEK